MTDLAPPLDAPHAIEPDLPQHFAERGHALVRGLASREEAASYRPVIEAAALDTAWDKRPLEKRDTYGKAFLQSFNLWQLDPVIERFVRSSRFANVAAALMGVPRVRLYHDQALCKEAGGGRTPWHQDQYYWPLDTDRTITMWMPLVDVSAEVGSMVFADGSHKLGDLRGQAISDASDAEFASLIEERGFTTTTYGAMRAGDATFHAGWTVHSAGPNPSDQLRTVMTVIYMADGARVVEHCSPAQELDRQRWLGNRAPGSLADHEDNPLLG